MDSDIPPPLDDKLKDSDFYLDDEEIILEDDDVLPVPTDYDVFGLASVENISTSENLSYAHPPLFSNFESESSPPLDDQQQHCDKSESPQPCDVAKEKESFKIDGGVSHQQLVLSETNDIIEETVSNCSLAENTLGKSVEVPNEICDSVEEQTFIITSVLKENDENIPHKEDVTSGEKLQSNLKDISNETAVDQSDIRLKEEDDDFNEFAEASSKGLHIESSGAFKTEESFEISSEFEDFTGLATHDDIPEPIPELKLDDDEDDDFNDFETAIPVNRQVEQAQTFVIITEEPEASAEIQFEADFSGFNAFSQPTVENSFEEFQDFKTAGFNEVKQPIIDSQDDDDDFGDFSDFTQAPVTIQAAEVQPYALIKPANVNGIIDMMFPPTSSCSQVHQETQQDGDYAKEQHIIKSDKFVNNFNDFDATLALGYLYNNSKTSRSLVTALGIDTRNIVSKHFS